jgi:hypothetical protein
MTGEKDLDILLSRMDPQLSKGEYVFCTLDEQSLSNLKAVPIATFRELEGVSVILSSADAKAAGLGCEFRSRMIKLTIHSSLDAVGFMAAIARKLAQAGIPANPISAFFHDYLFVPADRADDAMRALTELMEGAA